MSKRFDEIFQNQTGSQGIKHVDPLPAFQAHLIRPLFCGEGGQALIPKQDRQTKLFIDIVRKLANGLTSGTFAAVHVERQTDDQRASSTLRYDRLQPNDVILQPGTPDRHERRCQPPTGVRPGNTDSPFRNIKGKESQTASPLCGCGLKKVLEVA